MSQALAGTGFLPHRISGSPFERPKLSFARLIEGDFPGAARGLLRPRSLAPSERRTLADKWGLSTPDDESFSGKVLRMVENPLVLAGLVLAVRFPIPTVANLFKYAPALTGLARRPGMILRTVGSVDDLYHGVKAGKTTLPEAYKAALRDVHQFGRTYGDKVAESIGRFQLASGRTFGRRESILLAAKLDGMDVVRAGGKAALMKPIQEGPAFQTLYKEARAVTDDIWDKVFKEVEKRGLSKKEVAEVYEQLRNSGVGVPSGRRVKEYFPHRMIRSLKEWEEESKGLFTGLLKEEEYGRATLSASGRVTTAHAVQRHGGMVRDPDALKVVKDYLNDPTLPARLEGALAANPALRKYSLDYQDTMSAYIHSTARAWGWTVRGHGRDIAKGVKALEDSGLPHNVVRAAAMRDSYIPLAMGRQTYKQFLQTAQWDSTRIELVSKLQKGAMKGYVPEDVRGWLTKSLAEDRGLTSMRAIQGRAASHLYLGALGLNPTSAGWNMLQTILTTVPVIGPAATAKGFGRVFQKAGTYFQARKAGLLHDAALAKAYPEFVAEGLETAPLAEEALATAWEMGGKIRPNVKGVWDRAKSAMMALFQASETTVRLTAFEGTMAKGLAEGMTAAEVAPIARRVVETTQFLSGPANVPAALRNIGPLGRQFGTFVARYLGFLAGPATEMGSGAQAIGGRNLGTLGRAALTSGLAYEAGQEFLGQDISQGLMFGALPQPVPGSPFYPAPFVPPALSLVGGAVQAVMEGEIRPLGRQLPLLVPGGLAAARAATAYAPGMAEAIGRQYADYDQRTEDGRVPVYSSNGKLRAYLTPMQLHMQALGFPPGGAGALQKEQEMQQFLMAQRKRILGARNEFLTALVNNDSRRAQAIKEEYERTYPGMTIQVRPQDLRAVHLRMMVPRLERTLESLPRDVRPIFAEFIQMALLQESENLMGVDPSLLSAPGGTILSRDVYREKPPSNVLEEMYQRRAQRLRVRRMGRVSGGGSSLGPPLASSSSLGLRGEGVFGWGE